MDNFRYLNNHNVSKNWIAYKVKTKRLCTHCFYEAKEVQLDI